MDLRIRIPTHKESGKPGVGSRNMPDCAKIAQKGDSGIKFVKIEQFKIG